MADKYKDVDVKIVHCDISEDMKLRAIEFSVKYEQTAQQKEPEKLAKNLKNDFDSHYHKNWHCVVGKNFGSDIGFYQKHMIYFFIGDLAVLLWKAG